MPHDSVTPIRVSRGAAYGALAALFAMNLLNYIDRYVLAAVVGPVQQTLGVTEDSRGGLLSTAFFLSYALVSPLVGWLGDRVTRKYLLAIGVGIWSLATFASGLANTFAHMLLARSVLGIGEATYATIAPTLIADMFPRSARSRALAVFYVAIPLGSALGYVLGGRIEAAYNWRYAFFAVGLPGLFVALAALGIREPHRGASEAVSEADVLRHEALPASSRTYAELARNRSYVVNTLATALVTFALGGLAYWAPKFLSHERGLTLRDANDWLGVVLFVSGLVGTALGGWLGDRLAPRIPGAYFWVAGCSMLLSVPFVTTALVASRPAVIFSAMAIGLTLAFVYTGPSSAILVNVTLPRIRAAACAINILFIHLLGDIPSPPIMGLVGDLTGRMVWGLGITIPALAASGLVFCFGARYLARDEAAVLRTLHGAADPDAPSGAGHPAR